MRKRYKYQVSGVRCQVAAVCCWLLSVGCCLFFVSCGGAAAEPTPAPLVDVQVILVNSEITTEPTRFAVALLDSEQQFIHDAQVQFDYFDLTDPNSPMLESSATAVSRQTADDFSTIYTHPRTFGRVGDWGLQVSATLPDGSIAQQGISFVVVSETASLNVGAPAPIVETPTGADVAGELSRISTATEPLPQLYEVSLEEAVENGRSTILYFSTPAFCQTRLCAPGYDELTNFYEANGDEYNVIHVEVFTDLPNPAEAGWPLAPAMTAFGLTTEPWLYIIDASGDVAYRIEGLFTAVELEELLNSVQ